MSQIESLEASKPRALAENAGIMLELDDVPILTLAASNPLPD